MAGPSGPWCRHCFVLRCPARGFGLRSCPAWSQAGKRALGNLGALGLWPAQPRGLHGNWSPFWNYLYPPIRVSLCLVACLQSPAGSLHPIGILGGSGGQFFVMDFLARGAGFVFFGQHRSSMGSRCHGRSVFGSADVVQHVAWHAVRNTDAGQSQNR